MRARKRLIHEKTTHLISTILNQHISQPIGQGTLEDPDATGTSGTMQHGKEVAMMLRVEDTGGLKIVYKTQDTEGILGCCSAIVACLDGKTVMDASRFSLDDLAKYLEMPRDDIAPLAIYPMEALRIALRVLRKSDKSVEPEDTSEIICHCFQITENEVRRLIRDYNIESLKQYLMIGEAGTSCSTCQPEIRKIIRENNRQGG